MPEPPKTDDAKRRPNDADWRKRAEDAEQGCGRRVQGRHPLQPSDAIGAAAAQLGAQVIVLVVVLNKQLGLPRQARC